MEEKEKRAKDPYEEEPTTFEIHPDDVKNVPEDSDDDLRLKVNKIDGYEQKRDKLDSKFQTLTTKINGSIQEIENKLLAFEVSCEEDLTAMNKKLSTTKETKNKALEQIQDLEEQRKTLEDKLKTTAENVREFENRVQKLEDSYSIERIEKIDVFMTQKNEIENFLIQNIQEMDRQKTEVLTIQESINVSQDNLEQIKDRSDDLDAFLVKTRKEYANIREMINKVIEDFDQYVDSQRKQTQQIGNDFDQTIQSFKKDFQKQINAISADEIDHIKAVFKITENDALEKTKEITETLQEYLEGGKQDLSKQTKSGVQEIEAILVQTKSDLQNKLAEIEVAHQEQLKVQKTITDEKNALDKNLKVSKWMMIINVMVMVLTVTVLFLSLFF